MKKSWKTKLFGDNRTNFYGWLGAGILAIGGALWLALRALDTGAFRSPECLLLMAIFVVLLGHFCLALQNYHARVARTIDAEEERKGSDGAE